MAPSLSLDGEVVFRLDSFCFFNRIDPTSMNALQYQILTEKGLDKDVIRVLEEAFQSKKERLATKDDLEITKLALQKEIEKVRREIEEVRREVEEVKGTLRREIEEVRREIEMVRKEIKEVELRLTREIHRSNLKMVWVMIGLLSPIYVGILSLALKIFIF